MKTVLSIVIFTLTTIFSYGQILQPRGSGNSFDSDSGSGGDREGGILIETGYSLVGGIFGASGALLSNPGDIVGQVVGEGGYFINDRFAIKGKIGLAFGGGSTLTNLAGGGKYYIADVVPAELMVGIITGSGSSLVHYTATVGYSFALSDDIYLEPAVGINSIEGEVFEALKLSFALVIGN